MTGPRTYVRKDDRSEDEHKTHHFLVVGLDTFMSGWGGAADGVSIAAWACEDKDTARVFKWVKGRSDMRRVRLVDERKSMGGVWPCKSVFPRVAHFHVYTVKAGHSALAPAA